MAPGGRLCIAEFHPFTWVFGDDELEVVHDYWESGWFTSEGTYTDRDAPTSANEAGERNPTIGEVVTAVARRGLVVRSLREHDVTLFPRWPWLEHHGFDSYRQPAGRPRIPLVWTLLASAP